MPVAASDVKWRFSVKTGSAGNSVAGTAAGSLGKYMSQTDITDNVLGNLFDDVSGAENAASDVEYRCIFLYNSHATANWTGVKIWLQSEVAGGASVAIAIDNAAASAAGAASAQAAEIADEGSTPSGVGSFSSPTSEGAGLTVGDLNAGQCRAVWVRRTAANTGSVANDGCTLRARGDTV